MLLCQARYIIGSKEQVEGLTVFYGDINIGFLGKKREIDHTLGGVYGERLDDLAGQRLHKSLVIENAISGKLKA